MDKSLDALGFKMEKPAEVLAPFVQCYWSVLPESMISAPIDHKIITDGGSGIVLNFGDPISVYFSRKTQESQKIMEPWTCLLTRPTSKVTFLHFKDRVDAMGIRFRPGGAFALMGTVMNDLTSSVESFAFDEIPKFSCLLAKIKTQKGFQDRIEIVERFLLLALTRKKTLPDFWVQTVIATIRASDGSMKIYELAGAFGVSRSHLERRFRKEVGLSPKVYSQIVRIEKARTLIKSRKSGKLTEIGYAVNYYDQAHFIREFKAFVGGTPKAYQRQKISEIE